MRWKSSRKNLQFLIALLLGIFSILVMAAGVSQRIQEPVQLVSKFDFETGNFKGWKYETCCNHSVTTDTTHYRSGQYSARFELRRTDPKIHGSKRSELRLKAVPAHAEYWYGFSMKLDRNWVRDNSFDILAQWHNLPDAKQGETWRTPSFYFTTKLDQLRIVNRWDPKPVTRNNDPRPEGGIAQLWSGTFIPGEWTDWVVHAKWSHKADGILQVWRNGTLIIDKRGPNTYNDTHGPYFKIGIYKPDWASKPRRSKANTRVLYVDEFRMADSSGSYATVAPEYH